MNFRTSSKIYVCCVSTGLFENEIDVHEFKGSGYVFFSNLIEKNQTRHTLKEAILNLPPTLWNFSLTEPYPTLEVIKSSVR